MKQRPVFEQIDTQISVAVLGKQHHLPIGLNTAVARARKIGGHPGSICVVLPPGQSNAACSVPKVCDFQAPVVTDGVKLEQQGCAVIIQSRDDPIVILLDRDTGNCVVCKAEHRALFPRNGDCITCIPPSILENSVRMLLGYNPTTSLQALIVASMCADGYKVKLATTEDVLPTQSKRKALRAYPRPEFILPRQAIYSELAFLGIAHEHITIADNCPYHHPRMASGNMKHQSTNTVVVVRH